MATVTENLLTVKANLAAAWAAASANPKPTYNINGQMVDHAGYMQMLAQQLAEVNALLGASDGPWEVES